MIPFHVQILTNFTYHLSYKPIFTSHECHLLIKGVKNQRQSSRTPIRILFDDQNVGGAILKGVNEQSWMWETGVSRHAFKLKTR